MLRLLPIAGVIALLVSGCLGSGSAARATHTREAPTGRISVDARFLSGRCGLDGALPGCRKAAPTIRRYALTCDPAGGTMPHPALACAAIADFIRAGRPVGGCIGVLVRQGSTTRLVGTYAGRPFHLDITASYSFCGPKPHVVRDLWLLSTFPCPARALHVAHSHFAEATGCRRE